MASLSNNIVNKFNSFFDNGVIDTLARANGYLTRTSIKISPSNFILSFIMCCNSAKYTYAQWAVEIGALIGDTVSKQSVFGRMGVGSYNFTKKALEHILLAKTGLKSDPSLFSGFNKVLVQDSTTLCLPDCLSEDFPGSTSNGVKKAVARIQTVIDLKPMQFVDFDLTNYSCNDQSACSDILKHVGEGDLVIRDLGYAKLKVFDAITGKGAYFLSRLKFGIHIFELDGTPIDVKSLLDRAMPIDIDVLVGKKDKVPVRLVVVPLPDEIADERVRKSHCNRDKKMNPGKLHDKWSRFNVYVNNVPRSVWGVTQVVKAYCLRWKIETIFKSWKSGLNMASMLQCIKNKHRVKTTIMLMLIHITIFTLHVFILYGIKIKNEKGKDLSVIKCMTFLGKHALKILEADEGYLIQLLEKHCSYEKRYGRINMEQLINEIT